MNVTASDQYFRILEAGFQALREGQDEQALRHALEARELVKDGHEVLYLLGVCSWRLKRHANALQLLREAQHQAPDNREISIALAHLYSQLGKLADGLYHAKLAHTQPADSFLSQVVPEDLQTSDTALQAAGYAAYFSHAAIAYEGQRYAAAQEHCESELLVTPENVECLRLYGQVLNRRAQPVKASAALRGAIAGGQDAPAVLVELARALGGLGDFAGAVDTAREAVRRAPDDVDVLAGAIHALDVLPSGMDGSRAEMVARWLGMEKGETLGIDLVRAPFPGRPLRIGFLLNDKAAKLALDELDAVLNYHSDRVELYVYQLFLHNPKAISRLRGKVPNWRELADSDDLTAAYILGGDELDVLVDLCPMSPGARPAILAARPAPLQVAWHGEGCDHTLDAVLADQSIAAALPEGTPTLMMDNGVLARPLTAFAQAVSQAMEPPCEICGAITFGARFDLGRIVPSVATWARILNDVPGSTLLLGRVPVMERVACERLVEMFSVYGLADRVSLTTLDEGGEDDFFARIDVLLAPLGSPVVRDLVDALVVGVPVVVHAGQRVDHARAASVLAAVGQENWMAADDEQYVHIATAMGRTIETAAGLRRELLRVIGETPLCSGRAFVDDLEVALTRAYLARG